MINFQATIHNFNLGELTKEGIKSWLEAIERGTIPPSSKFYFHNIYSQTVIKLIVTHASTAIRYYV